MFPVPVRPSPVPPALARPALVLGRSLGGGGIEAALALLTSCPDARITLLERDWPDVDASRAVVTAAGLDARIAVRPHAALRHVYPPSAPSVAA